MEAKIFNKAVNFIKYVSLNLKIISFTTFNIETILFLFLFHCLINTATYYFLISVVGLKY